MWRVCDDRESAARDCTGHQRVFEFRRDALDERAEIGQRGVVGDGCESGRAEEQRAAVQAPDERLEPVSLE